MRILVTGHLGFIGRHVTHQLVDRGHFVVGLDALVEQVHGSRVASGLDDICDYDSVASRLQHADAVIHLAAAVGVGQSQYEVARYVHTNSYGTAVLLQAILDRPEKVKRLVVASSMSIYGEGALACGSCGAVDDYNVRAAKFETPCCDWGVVPIPTRETHPLNPASVYAVTKRDQEELCLTIGRAYSIPTIALRFFNVFGPGQALSNPYTGAIAIFASRLLNGKPPLVYEDGQQLRDFIHVTDVARAVVMAVETDLPGAHAFNVGTGIPTPILAVAEELQRLLGGPKPEVTGQGRAGDVRHCYADVSAIASALGFRAEKDLKLGLEEMAPYLRAQKPEDRFEVAQSELAERGLVS